jgi:hypothetical protein
MYTSYSVQISEPLYITIYFKIQLQERFADYVLQRAITDIRSRQAAEAAARAEQYKVDEEELVARIGSRTTRYGLVIVVRKCYGCCGVIIICIGCIDGRGFTMEELGNTSQ